MPIEIEMIFDTEKIKKEVNGEIDNNFGTGSVMKVDDIIVGFRRLANLKALIGHLPEPNQFFFLEHCNYFNGLSFIRMLIESYGQIDELWICTFNVNYDGINFFVNNIGKTIKKMSLIVSERFKGEDTKFMPLKVNMGRNLNLVFSPTHKKVILARIGNLTYGLEGSANLTGVSKNEQSLLYNHTDIFDFRRSEIEKEVKKRTSI